MKWIEELGERVEKRWREVSYSEDAFSEIAANALTAAECSPEFFREVTAWGLGDHVIPFQVDIEAMFGQPPICIYVNPLQTFYIQALVWLDSTTSVHQHGFSGAFKVVEGQSVHARHSFDASDRVNSRMIFGTINYLDAEVLSVGDVRKIERGSSLIHSVFHLDRPSVTLVVRTFGDTVNGPQYDYLRPWLAVDPFYKSPRLQRNLQILTAVKEVDRPRYIDTLIRLIPTTDLYTTYRYMRHYYECPARSDERASLAALVRTAHGERGDKLVACLDKVAQDGFLLDKRKQLRDRDHRFFVALLLNVPDRDTILRLIQKRYPGDPVEHVVRWIGELCDGDAAPLLPLAESTLYALKSMARGSTLEHVVRDFREHYDEDAVLAQLDSIKELYELLRTSSHFKPVLLDQAQIRVP
jgi:hypothetical protein